MTENATTNAPAATQGGAQGLGHVATGPPSDTIYGFHSLEQQKGAAEDKYKTRVTASSSAEPLQDKKEDTSFMNRKPGGGETLPGWEKAKEIISG
ncbi:hypothetical protein BJY01DRAFT_100024 [Aspergillus pseudoustus]|uniref:Uncharacterized protein n=1 Tax=Aspergillus pseudoustus TaxID=1810923 RepID=A0ABR4IY53_9EURO